MINVKIYVTGEEIRGFKVEGHALFDDPGKDIVCAAVSILTINTINAIDTFVKDEKKDVAVDETNGSIECVFLEKPCSDTKLLVDTFILGIKGIREEYGRKYVGLEEQHRTFID